MSDFLECPVCRSSNFFIRTPATGMLFFKITAEHKAVPTREGVIIPNNTDFSSIECTSCSWQGTFNELKEAKS